MLGINIGVLVRFSISVKVKIRVRVGFCVWSRVSGRVKVGLGL